MIYTKSFAATVSVLVVAASATALATGTTASSRTQTTSTLCRYNMAPVSGGAYMVQNDEWNSSATECVTTQGGASFQVRNSQIAVTPGGPPGGYPSIFAGCHWGICTSGGLASTPLMVSSLTPGRVTSTFVTTEPAGGSYDVAYDIWLNQTQRTSTEPNGTEVMVWLGHRGHVQPAGAIVARDVRVGSRTYDVWYTHGTYALDGTVSFVLTSPATAVWSLDLGQVIQAAVQLGHAQRSWYLIDVEAGFEIWQGGSGLAVNQFNVVIHPPAAASGEPGTSAQPATSSQPNGPGLPAFQIIPGWKFHPAARHPARATRVASAAATSAHSPARSG